MNNNKFQVLVAGANRLVRRYFIEVGTQKKTKTRTLFNDSEPLLKNSIWQLNSTFFEVFVKTIAWFSKSESVAYDTSNKY
jgi:hypothetical protein